MPQNSSNSYGKNSKSEHVELSELKKFEIDPFSNKIDSANSDSTIELIVPISSDPHPVVLALFATIVSIIENIFKNDPKNVNIEITFLDWGNVLTDVTELNFRAEYAYLVLDREDTTFQHSIKIRDKEFQSFVNNVFHNIAWHNSKIRDNLFPKISWKKYYHYLKQDDQSDRKLNNDIISSVNNLDKKFFTQDGIKKIIGAFVQDDDDVATIQVKKKIYSYSDTTETASMMTTIIDILDQIGKSIITNSKNQKRFLIMPRTGKDIINEILNESFIPLDKKKNVTTAIESNHLITFTEARGKNRVFPSYFTLASRYCNKNNPITLDDLYFAGILDTLRCSYFQSIGQDDLESFSDIWNDISNVLAQPTGTNYMLYQSTDLKLGEKNAKIVVSAIQNGFLELQKQMNTQFELIMQ
jgi:hypothetical protein